MREKYFADDRFIIPDDIKNMSSDKLQKEIDAYESKIAYSKASNDVTMHVKIA